MSSNDSTARRGDCALQLVYLADRSMKTESALPPDFRSTFQPVRTIGRGQLLFPFSQARQQASHAPRTLAIGPTMLYPLGPIRGKARRAKNSTLPDAIAPPRSKRLRLCGLARDLRGNAR